MPIKRSIPTTFICRQCGGEFPTKPSQRNQKFCGRSCHGKSNIHSIKAWEQAMAQELTRQGWQVFSPTICCDRIGIKDGAVYFLEFKPKGRTKLRAFQQAVRNIVPHMYRVAVGDFANGNAAEVGVVKLKARGLTTGSSHRNTAKKRQAGTPTSRFKGVQAIKEGRWRARISIDGIRISLGEFETEEAAARAWDAAAKQAYGPGSYCNFP